MPLILRRDREASTDDFWLVYRDGQERAVGRVYRKTAPNGSDVEWFWGLGFPAVLDD